MSSGLHGPALTVAQFQGPQTARFHAQCLLVWVLTTRFHARVLAPYDVGMLHVKVVSTLVEVLALALKGILASRWILVVLSRLRRYI